MNPAIPNFLLRRLDDELPGPYRMPATCIREGRQWVIRLGNRNASVGHSVGMLHLAVLLANANVEIPAIELACGVAAVGSARVMTAPTQPVVDRTAIQQYRQRLAQLRAEIDELDSVGRPERAAQARTEQDWLLAELSSGTGLGGRVRRFPDDAERARIAVGKAIRRAIARVYEADRTIGEHLHRAVHTGMRCAYHAS